MDRPAPGPAVDFYQATPGLRLSRLTLNTFERLWPALAVRAAHRLFGTPMPLRWLQKHRPWPPGWRMERWPFEAAELTIYDQPVAPHGPVALLVHGWSGHAGQLLPLADSLAQHGWRPVLVDMPGHGRSSGSFSNLPQFARAIEYVTGRLQQQGHAVQLLAGHSLGANAAAFAVSRGLPVQRLVLIAPPASPRDYTRYFARMFGLSDATRLAMEKRLEAREGVLLPQLEPAAVGPRIRVPALVVHDREDRVNAFRDGQAFAHAIRGARLHATQGLGHARILKDAGVLGRIALFATP